MVSESFVQLSLIILVVLGVSVIMRVLKQPLVIGYILSGILVGQYVLDWTFADGLLESFATIGIAILLFIVGLSLDPKSIRSVGRASLVIGVGQVLFTSIVGFVLMRLLGFSSVVSLFGAIALTFSSTIIITKLLSDRGDIDSLYGRLAIGLLVVQDIMAALILMGVSSFASSSFEISLLVRTALIGVGLLLGVGLVGKFLLPGITNRIARSQEFLLLFALGWCFVVGSLFFLLDFSLEIGALLAGFTLSFSAYRFEIASRLKPLRDFFLVMFFIVLGSQMTFVGIGEYIVPTIVLSLFILVGNPLIVTAMLGLMGYSSRVGFFTGLTVAQISEFSLILIALVARIGSVSPETLSMVTLIGLVTFAGSTYMIMYADRIYPLIARLLKVFERKGKLKGAASGRFHGVSTVLLGHDRVGFSLMRSLRSLDEKYVVVDYNPDIVQELTERGVPSLYGDASDMELLEELNVRRSRLIISTIPYLETSLSILSHVRKVNTKGVVIMTANNVHDALRLYDAGADYVLLPHVISGSHAAVLIERCKDKKHLYKRERSDQLRYLSAHVERSDRLKKSSSFLRKK